MVKSESPELADSFLDAVRRTKTLLLKNRSMLNRTCESDPITLSHFQTYNSLGIEPVVNPTFPVKDNKLP